MYKDSVHICKVPVTSYSVANNFVFFSELHTAKDVCSNANLLLLSRAHSFPRQILPIPRRRLQNSAANRGKFLEFHSSPRPPIVEYTVPTLAQLCPKTLALLSHQTIKQKFYTITLGQLSYLRGGAVVPLYTYRTHSHLMSYE